MDSSHSTDTKKLKITPKVLSLENLVSIATTIDKGCSNISYLFETVEFFDYLMMSLGSLNCNFEIDKLDNHKLERRIRAILHILHHLFIINNGPIAIPRELKIEEAFNLMKLALGHHLTLKLLPERLRLRAQICCKLLLSEDLIIQTVKLYPLIEEKLCACIAHSLSKGNYYSKAEVNFFIWVVNILPYFLCSKSISSIINILSSSSCSIWERPEPCMMMSGMSKFLMKNSPCKISNFTNILIAACKCLTCNIITDKVMFDALFIIHTYCDCSNFFVIKNHLKSAIENSAERALLNPKGSTLMASIISTFVKNNMNNLSISISIINLLLTQSKNNPCLMSYLLSVSRVVRNISLEAYRQLWLNDSLSFLLKQYNHKNLLQTIDLLCPLFMFSGGIHWLVQYISEFSFIFNDIINASLLTIFPDVYQSDLLTSCATDKERFSTSSLKYCLSFFRLGCTRLKWVSFCIKSTCGRIIAALASIVYYFLNGDLMTRKDDQYLSILHSYSDSSEFSIFLLWPIVLELRKNGGILDTRSITIQRYLKGLESRFDTKNLFCVLPSSLEKLNLSTNLNYSFAQLSLFIASRFITNFYNFDNGLNFRFKKSLFDNSLVLQTLSKIYTYNDIKDLDLNTNWALATLDSLFSDQLTFASVDSFFFNVQLEPCTFCAIVSLLHCCDFLAISDPMSFLWNCLRKSITLQLCDSLKRIHPIDICLLEFFKLSSFTEEFKFSLSRLIFILTIEDAQPFLNFIVACLR